MLEVILYIDSQVKAYDFDSQKYEGLYLEEMVIAMIIDQCNYYIFTYLHLLEYNMICKPFIPNFLKHHLG